MKKLTIIGCLLLAAATSISAQQTGFPKLTGPYLGQKPPGMTSEIFAPRIVSKEGVQSKLIVTHDGSEIIFKTAMLLAVGAEECPYGVLFYSGRGENKDIYLLYPGATEPRRLTDHPAQDLCPAPSPDGKRIAFLSDRDGNFEIYSMAPDGGDLRRLTFSPESEDHPEYTPDGKRILFVRDFEKRTEIWIMDADGKNQRRLTDSGFRDERPFLSPDGGKILFMSNRAGNYDIYTMAPDGSDQRPLKETPEWEIFPCWSPDGQKIAYSQKYRADGRMQGMLRVINADGSSDRALTSIETRDENVVWSPDGRFILFQSVRDGNSEVYRARSDGSEPIRLTNHPSWDGWASFISIGEKSAAAGVLSEASSAGYAKERKEVERVISSVIGWAKDKNLDLFFSSIAQDEDYISVTPGNRVIKRFEDVKQNVPFWMSPDFKYVRHELKDLEIKFARCGEVAWFYCVLDDINTYKGQPASWENARWTGVVEKRDGKWVVVSQHFSFASDR